MTATGCRAFWALRCVSPTVAAAALSCGAGQGTDAVDRSAVVRDSRHVVGDVRHAVLA